MNPGGTTLQPVMEALFLSLGTPHGVVVVKSTHRGIARGPGRPAARCTQLARTTEYYTIRNRTQQQQAIETKLEPSFGNRWPESHSLVDS